MNRIHQLNQGRALLQQGHDLIDQGLLDHAIIVPPGNPINHQFFQAPYQQLGRVGRDALFLTLLKLMDNDNDRHFDSIPNLLLMAHFVLVDAIFVGRHVFQPQLGFMQRSEQNGWLPLLQGGDPDICKESVRSCILWFLGSGFRDRLSFESQCQSPEEQGRIERMMAEWNYKEITDLFFRKKLLLGAILARVRLLSAPGAHRLSRDTFFARHRIDEWVIRCLEQCTADLFLPTLYLHAASRFFGSPDGPVDDDDFQGQPPSQLIINAYLGTKTYTVGHGANVGDCAAMFFIRYYQDCLNSTSKELGQHCPHGLGQQALWRCPHGLSQPELWRVFPAIKSILDTATQNNAVVACTWFRSDLASATQSRLLRARGHPGILTDTFNPVRIVLRKVQQDYNRPGVNQVNFALLDPCFLLPVFALIELLVVEHWGNP
jgi:hypothetical protein